ncbi:MAG: flagellar hook-associated protein FlgL [bacterium]|nr:flagellar hook-associated protein FlgL [bacterium]
MRVTSGMITGRVIFNSQRSLSRLLQLQGQLSSGRRIERPSDDPVGTLRDLDYRNVLAQNDQYLKNISRAKTWAQNYDTVLSDLKDMVQQAKDLTITMSDDSVSTESRIGSHTVAKSILEQIGQLANGKLDGMYVFSGFQSDTQSLDISADGVRYRGDRGSIEYPIEAAYNSKVNLIGDDVFLKQLKTLGAEADLNLAVSPSTLLANLNSGNGVDLLSGGTFEITDETLGVTATIDISGAATIDDVITAINTQLPPTISNLTFGIAGAGNALSIDIDESAPRLVNDGTLLSDINEGHSLDLSYGRMRLTDGAGINMDVDFNSPAIPVTVGDLRNAFNTQMAAYGPPLDNVSMQLNAAGTALEILDANGVPVGLSVAEVNPDSTTAADLGLLGNIGASLTGHDLKPSYKFSINDIAGTTAADLGIVDEYRSDGTGTDLNPILTAATAAATSLSDLNNGAGFSGNEMVFWQGQVSETFDISSVSTVQELLDLFNSSYLDITAELNSSGTGIQISNNDPTLSFSIEDVGDGTLSKELGLFGAADMMASLTMLTKALKNDDREGVSLLMQNFDDAIDHLLEKRSTTGSHMARLETTEYRLLDQKLTYTKLLSEVEDADITDLITQLTTQENNYQASLMAAAKIVQPTLVDFLR